jgi:hypothetical protein
MVGLLLAPRSLAQAVRAAARRAALAVGLVRHSLALVGQQAHMALEAAEEARQ